MTIRSAQQNLLTQLKLLYDEREAANIADLVLEHITGKTKSGRLLIKDELLSTAARSQLEQITKELATHRPVQYVLGEAWFAGMCFFVNEYVLIPRPETEELVNWVVDVAGKAAATKILDIGTGSGCIPTALKRKLPAATVVSLDVSTDAIAVAVRNAQALNADIELIELDILDESKWDSLPVFDIIVSNPPYVKHSEQDTMSKHVTDFEPALALFVPDEDALLFYRKIAGFGKTHLKPNGSLFFEINEALGREVKLLLEENGYSAELRKDLQGRDRMVMANFII